MIWFMQFISVCILRELKLVFILHSCNYITAADFHKPFQFWSQDTLFLLKSTASHVLCMTNCCSALNHIKSLHLEVKWNKMKHSFYSPLLWENKYPRIVYSHNGATDTREHSTSVPSQKNVINFIEKTLISNTIFSSHGLMTTPGGQLPGSSRVGFPTFKDPVDPIPTSYAANAADLRARLVAKPDILTKPQAIRVLRPMKYAERKELVRKRSWLNFKFHQTGSYQKDLECRNYCSTVKSNIFSGQAWASPSTTSLSRA